MSDIQSNNACNVDWLYEQLTRGEDRFCESLLSLAQKAMDSQAPDRFEQMWGVYLSLMNRIGQELFGEDLSWNPRSKLIAPTLNKLLVEGYDHIIHLLILGVYLLLDLTEPPGYRTKLTALKNLSLQYNKITEQYLTGGVLTTANRGVKWDYIDHSNRFFGAVYDMVCEGAKGNRERLLSAEERRALLQKQFEEKLDEIFRELDDLESDEPKPPSKKKFRIKLRKKGKK